MAKDEYQAPNIPFQDRGKRADEFIEAMKKMQIDAIAEFERKYYGILATMLEPERVQKVVFQIIMVVIIHMTHF